MNEALKLAAGYGDHKIVACLLSIADPKHNGSIAIQEAAKNGRSECLKALIPFSDPNTLNVYPLRAAAVNGHAECCRLLIPVSDSDTAISVLGDDNNPKKDMAIALIDSIRQEQSMISRHIPKAVSVKKATGL